MKCDHHIGEEDRVSLCAMLVFSCVCVCFFCLHRLESSRMMFLDLFTCAFVRWVLFVCWVVPLFVVLCLFSFLFVFCLLLIVRLCARFCIGLLLSVHLFGVELMGSRFRFGLVCAGFHFPWKAFTARRMVEI